MRYDNRADNLRIVTRSINSRNLTKRCDNTTGIQGVGLERKGKYMHWRTQIVNNEGIHLSKRFNIDKLGNDEAKRLAIEQRQIWEVLYGYIGE